MYPNTSLDTARPARSLLCLTLLLAILALAGCGRTSPPETPAPSSGASTGGGTGGGFKVALVMSGPTSDNGWNAGAYKALLAVRKELNLSEADSPYVDNQTSPGDQEKNLRDFASKKFNIVFGHGNEYEDPALKMEGDFPDTLFVISSGSKMGKNTTPIVLQLEDGAYLEGMLAAGMSKTGILAAVGAEQIPPVKSVFTAFEAGARAVNPNIKFLQPSYTKSWDDPNLAKQATLPLIDQGADVIMQDVDAAAPGVFNAVKERNKPDKPVYALGTNNDQNAIAPDVILASAPIYIDRAFVPIAQQVKAGTFKPNTTPYDMHSGVIGFVLNPQLESRIPASLKKQLDDMQKKITDHTFTVPKGI